jgi:hypothetical protein
MSGDEPEKSEEDKLREEEIEEAKRIAELCKDDLRTRVATREDEFYARRSNR